MTIATYWSPATMLSPIEVPMTEAIRRPVDLARARTGWMSRSRNPASSMIAAKRQRAEDQPDREEHRRHAAAREQGVDRRVAGLEPEPVGHRLEDADDRGRERPELGPADERRDDGCLGEAGQHAGEQRAGEDRQEWRRPPHRQDDQQDHRQQVERRDPELVRERRLRLGRVERRAGRRVVEADDRNTRGRCTIAGPDVQIIAPMCWFVVTPPTIDGVRTVVSETGLILSPK